MEKQDVKLESFLTVISPGQYVRIMDENKVKGNRDISATPDELTEFKGTAVAAFKKYDKSGVMVKHIAPRVERETADDVPRYVMNIYRY